MSISRAGSRDCLFRTGYSHADWAANSSIASDRPSSNGKSLRDPLGGNPIASGFISDLNSRARS